MKCNMCNRNVKDAPDSKMKHALRYHPEVMFQHALEKGMTPYQIGEHLGQYFQANGLGFVNGVKALLKGMARSR